MRTCHQLHMLWALCALRSCALNGCISTQKIYVNKSRETHIGAWASKSAQGGNNTSPPDTTTRSHGVLALSERLHKRLLSGRRAPNVLCLSLTWNVQPVLLPSFLADVPQPRSLPLPHPIPVDVRSYAGCRQGVLLTGAQEGPPRAEYTERCQCHMDMSVSYGDLRLRATDADSFEAFH